MDSFKPAELSRLDLGGNVAWKEFWEEKSGGRAWGRPGGEGGEREVGERYGGAVGEEWKERLGCRVEGREFKGLVGGRGASPLVAGGVGAARSRKERNEEFFASKGDENAGRPEGVAPSQGGKYAGFGSEPAAAAAAAAGRRQDGAGSAIPGVGEFQRDPVAALSKGLGWFTSTVGKGAKTVNDGWIQPTAQKVRHLLTMTGFGYRIKRGAGGARC